jgi:hypothetical protein
MKADVANVLGDRSGSAGAGESMTISETVSASTVATLDDTNGAQDTSTGTLEAAPLAPFGESPVKTAIPSTVTHSPSTSEGGPKVESEGTAGGSSLVGRINNLISSDLENIVGMTELPMVIVYTPLKIVISVYFLYRLLGWRYATHLFVNMGVFIGRVFAAISVFVGMGLMVIGYIIPGAKMLPLCNNTYCLADHHSGQLGKLLHKLQVERAKKVCNILRLDAVRVSSIIGIE